MSPARRATHRKDMDYVNDFYDKYRSESIDKQQFRLPVVPQLPGKNRVTSFSNSVKSIGLAIYSSHPLANALTRVYDIG